MPLPDLIEIVPLSRPVEAEVRVPGSKSITNRALILAALANGTVTLQGALWSEDTQVTVEALQHLGFKVEVAPDPQESSNRQITVHGQGGRIPRGGTVETPLELFVGNAGTAARFLTALVSLGEGVYRLNGVLRMLERPQAALFEALRQLGYHLESPNNHLPVLVHGGGRKPGRCQVRVTESSQFASALLLCAECGGWDVRVEAEDPAEATYITMTRRLLEIFPHGGGAFQIEPDASSGSYFWAAGWLITSPTAGKSVHAALARRGTLFREDRLPVRVRNWPNTGWQIDAEFPQLLPLPDEISRLRELGDSIMTSIVLSADLGAALEVSGGGLREHRFTHLGRLRLQECERVQALRTELSRCGARVREVGDTLLVVPGNLHGAEIETYNDHRMAMCFAVLALKVAGIKIRNPACVRKTFPEFYLRLAAPPPDGLGALVRDGRTGARLTGEGLVA